MIRNPLRYFAHLADTQGPRAHLQLGDRHFYLLNDPELIRDLLITQGALFEKFPGLSAPKACSAKGC